MPYATLLSARLHFALFLFTIINSVDTHAQTFDIFNKGQQASIVYDPEGPLLDSELVRGLHSSSISMERQPCREVGAVWIHNASNPRQKHQ